MPAPANLVSIDPNAEDIKKRYATLRSFIDELEADGVDLHGFGLVAYEVNSDGTVSNWSHYSTRNAVESFALPHMAAECLRRCVYNSSS